MAAAGHTGPRSVPDPGWVVYDAHLTSNGIAELRRVEYVTVER